jgi:hypothetical protein
VAERTNQETSLYRALGTPATGWPGFRLAETVITEQVETVDRDRSIEWLLGACLIA